MLYDVGALSIPLTLLVHRVLPESPAFLAARGRYSELQTLLGRLRPDRRDTYGAASFQAAEVTASGNTIGLLLGAKYRRLSLTIGLTAFLSLFAIFGLTGWIPTVMMARGETFAASFGFGALMQAASFFGGLTLAALADRNLRAAPLYLAAWWLLGGFSVITLVFVGGHGLNLAVVVIAGFCIVGAQHVLNNVTASAYDISVRASGVGMMLGVGRLGAILGPFVAGLLQQATGGTNAVFWLIGGAAGIAAVSAGSLAMRPAIRAAPVAVAAG